MSFKMLLAIWVMIAVALLATTLWIVGETNKTNAIIVGMENRSYPTVMHLDDALYTVEPMEPDTTDVVLTMDVLVTVYHAVASQTDSTPHITADMTTIDIAKAGEYRFCALSRDLLKTFSGDNAMFDFGDTIELVGTGKYDGRWHVRDTMHQRKKNQIDLLVYENEMFKGEGTIIKDGV